MDSIRFDSAFIEYTIEQISRSTSDIWECSEEITKSVQVLCDCKEFGIEKIQENMLVEINRIKQLYEKLDAVKSVSEKVAFIYTNADNSVKRNIGSLPVLTHGNICSRADTHSVFYGSDILVCKTEIKETSASRLLKSNTVMHEDWLLALTVEKIMD